jgi:hypothetical protein
MTTKIMKCGHAANGIDGKGNPVCVICVGIRPGACEVDEEPPDLVGRIARCVLCAKERPSNPDMQAFFMHRPDQEYDEYYCGCKGWD